MPFDPRPTRQIIFADQLLTPAGWRRNAHVVINADGLIARLGDGRPPGALCVDALLPAPGNVHSHSFQRAMAGLTERRSSHEQHDDFWSWRETMYRFLSCLGPDDIEAIAAQVQMETLEAGYASIGEFHYLHHQPDGSPYDDPLEMTNRLMQSAENTGIGYTHLPVLYMRGGLVNQPLEGGQRRFALTPDEFGVLFERINAQMRRRPTDFNAGAAAHSLRAVSLEGLAHVTELAKDGPLHIHIAEQIAEVQDVEKHLGARPVQWLLDNLDVDERWCLVHATHLTKHEISSLAATQSVVGLCPITEANLGDGVFPANDFLAAGGRIAIGTDSNIRITLAEELCLLEYSQRLKERRRIILSDPSISCGRYLFQHAVSGSSQTLGRNAGRIEAGALADLTALNGDSTELPGLEGDRLLDAWIFAGDNRLVSDVWSAGRHVVRDGQHIKHREITDRFIRIVCKLRDIS
ncbi:MAG: formimidoylglutamate deiminase [Pseudomonadota bacterium]